MIPPDSDGKGAGASCIQADLPLDPTIAAWDLGAGETAVLNWAFQQREFEAILDDRAARKGALVQRIPCRGTIGVIPRNGLETQMDHGAQP